MRSVVVLPAPLGPKKPVIVPGSSEKERSSTAVSFPKRLVSDSATTTGAMVPPYWSAKYSGIVATTGDRRETDSGIEVKSVYTAEDVAGLEPELPGEFPYTRGPYPTMYRGRPWTIRQYAGFGSAEQTNERFRYLLERGQTGLSVAFDLPTQLGYDSDDPLAAGEVGRTGVAVDSIEDMRIVLQGMPLDRVSTSMTINAPAALLLLLYELVAEEEGVPGAELRGTVQNDILKEYIARGNY